MLYGHHKKYMKKFIKCLRLLENLNYVKIFPISSKRKSLYDQLKWKKFDNGKDVFVVSHDSK